jgi:hypothetical protein
MENEGKTGGEQGGKRGQCLVQRQGSALTVDQRLALLFLGPTVDPSTE